MNMEKHLRMNRAQNTQQKKKHCKYDTVLGYCDAVLSVQFHTLYPSSEQCRSTVSFNLIYLAMIIWNDPGVSFPFASFRCHTQTPIHTMYELWVYCHLVNGQRMLKADTRIDFYLNWTSCNPIRAVWFFNFICHVDGGGGGVYVENALSIDSKMRSTMI